MNNWIDITQPIFNNMVTWPGDTPVNIAKKYSIENGDGVNVTDLSLCAHTSTHMDAPLHFIDKGLDISQAPLDKLTGKAIVIEIDDPEVITTEELKRHNIEPGAKVLFKTKNSVKDWSLLPFQEEYVYIDAEAALFLKEKQIDLVGVDYLSVGLGDSMAEVHKTLLGSGMWIVEGLNLRDVKPGEYEIVCLPLKIAGSDGSPARVIIRTI